MSTFDAGPIIALVMLGAVHGVNPAMGWLFAVALGLQERTGRAVWRALPPLAAGHAAAVAAMVMVAFAAGRIIPPQYVRIGIAAILLVFGIHRLLRGHRHNGRTGMRVGARDLAIWSFLMATAHGAGLMVLPFMPWSGNTTGHEGHMAHASAFGDQGAAVAAALIHAGSYLLVTGLIAVIVYERVGLRLLRTAWINLDVLWAIALIVTAILTPFIHW